MRTTSTEKLSQLQKNPRNIRNICILAHVDHGKTTLADTLVASNGVISQRMAGKLRYLDSREDEQLRGITMKSSAISLQYNAGGEDYLINLIDSPGHIDFSSEVSTAVRLCDGAVVLVDVVEGVCPQTHAVLRQAWLENIKPVLVLNKVDRLITELKMTPLEAHLHLQQILEQVNAITGELFTSQILEKTATKASDAEHTTPSDDQTFDWSSGLEETDDSKLYFSPDQGNVVFGSAIDGWGFGINHFAELFSTKLGFKAEVLRKTLWGDFYLEGKTKRIRKGAQAKAKKPLFVQFILENLWAVYEAVLVRRDKDKIEKIVKSMNLNLQARDTRHNDPRVLLHAITSQWLPLSAAVLAMVSQCLPSPLDVSTERVEKLLCSSTRRFDSLPDDTRSLREDFMACNPAPEAPVIIYVSKMFSVDRKSLPQHKQRPLTIEEMNHRRDLARQRHANKMAAIGNEPAKTETVPISEDGSTALPPSEIPGNGTSAEPVDDHVFIAFARVFSGTVTPGTKLYVLGPKHDPASLLEELEDSDGDVSVLADQAHIHEVTVGDLYMFMGKELETMDQVPAGNLLGLGGLGNYVIKSATLSSTYMCPAFTDMYFEAAPIVKVALEPSHPSDMRKLVEGLKLLNQADPCVRVSVQESGEHIIMAAGEVHLNKCLDDLKLRYAKVEIIVSPTLVPFRETVVIPPTVDNVNETIEGQVPSRPSREEDGNGKETGIAELQTANRKCTLRVRACPLPESVTELLSENDHLLKTLDMYTSAKISGRSDTHLSQTLKQSTLAALKDFKMNLKDAFVGAGSEFWQGAVDQIWCFGPKRNGPNLLINRVENYKRHSIWSCLEREMKDDGYCVWDFDSSIISGFQMASLSGPLCEEPMRGVGFIIEKWDTDKEFRISQKRQTARDPKLIDRERRTSERERRISERVRSVSGMFSEDSEDELQILRCESADSPKISASQLDNDDTSVDSQSTKLNVSVDACARDMKTVHFDESKESDPAPSAGLETEKRQPISYGPFSGQLMYCMKEGCRRAFQANPQRLMAAMYSCTIQATAEVLGKLYGVLGKRNGRILDEDMREGTSIFNITALLPVIESFGFAEEIRKKTSGLASPQLRFSHWEVIDLDPFWVPTTEEEYLHFGDKADSENQARRYMDQVRKRKGLKIEEKLVESAEKQRNLSKNK